AYYDKSMGDLTNEILASGQIANGKYVALFSESFAKKNGNSHIVTTDNMTNAMELALKMSGVGPGDEVLTSPFSCMASNSPIATLGATP
ncbi:TPA: DegT/DnrJ/EryC1/StrS family aminotransferase, partial [Escherichia coli]